jgi:SAM-dependent methyltransferase
MLSPLVRAEHPWIDPVLARLYDVFPFDLDVPMYLELAAAEGGRVLEAACGSGRLVLPLARAGHEVTGVDQSPHMLALARAKLEAAGEAVAGRCRLVEGDMVSFDLAGAGPGLRAGSRFDLAAIAVKSFGYLQTRLDQAMALERVAAHLRPSGVLVLDLLNPSPAWLSEPPGTLRQDLVEEVPGLGVVTRVECPVSTDLAAQVRVIRSTYEIVDGEGRVTKRLVEWPFRFTYRFEAEHLLERAGFRIEAVCGGYRGEPFTSDSRHLVLVARLGPSGNGASAKA